MTLIIILIMYFIPAIVAVSRKHNNAAPVVAINILLGWTFIGWVVAMVWALTDNRKVQS